MSDTSRDLAAPGDYEQIISDLNDIISGARQRAVTAINAEMVMAYWRIGERIVEEEQSGAGRAGYGERLLVRLADALSQEHGRGFSLTNLKYMRQFYQTYPNRHTLRDQLSWAHYRTLMRLSAEQREFYERLTVSGRWSTRTLEQQINSDLYTRAGLSRKPELLAGALPEAGAAPLTFGAAFRDPYIFDFLGLEGDSYSEKDLEAALVRNMEQFLLALGDDFAFMARQRRMSIGQSDYYVDLVFYHRGLRCLVLVDLKIGPFEPADAAQMRIYLEWVKRYDKREGEEDPIGLILCGSRDQQVVELLLSGEQNRMQIAQYLLLNSEAVIKRRLAQMSEAYEQLIDGTAEAAD